MELFALAVARRSSSSGENPIIKSNNNNNNNNHNHIHRRNSRFSTISSLRREPSLTRALKWPRSNRVQTTCNTSSACHVQHVVLRSTWYEGIAQLLSFDKVEIAFI